jgi:RNA polymerase sigma factor (sigma-70 family)
MIAEQRKAGPLDQAGRQLVEAHLHLANPLAWERYRKCDGQVPLDELRCEARLALTRAACHFDPEREVPFGAFATLVIRRWLAQVAMKWQAQARLVVYLPLQPDEDGKGELASAEPACTRTRPAEDEALYRELQQRLQAVLPARWLALVRGYYFGGRTMREVGREHGISRQRVKQILDRAAEELRLAYLGRTA